MRANLKAMDAWLANPEPGAEQIINGRTPHSRVKELRKTHAAQVRAKQIDLYNSVREEHASNVKDYCDVLRKLLSAVETMRKDLRQGKVDPDEVMAKVGQSMRGLRDLAVDAEAVERSGVTATEMVDMDPADYEESRATRFPSAGNGPVVTVGFLRGEESGPFAALDGGDD